MAAEHAEIRALAESQHGIVTREQLRLLGWSDGGVSGLVANGRLIRVGRGVFALGHRRPDDRHRWKRDVMARGDNAWLGDQSGAALWDLHLGDDGTTRLVVPAHGSRAAVTGVRCRRSSTLDPDEHTTVRYEIPVTTVARTLVDLASRVRPAQLRRAVERAEALELFDLRQVTPMLSERGAKPLRVLLDDARAHGLPMTRSLLEAEFIEFCLAYGLPRPQINRWDGSREVDFRWAELGVVVEADGWEFHRTRAAFERDAERTQALAAGGWIVIRVTWRQLRSDPEAVAARLRPVLGVK